MTEFQLRGDLPITGLVGSFKELLIGGYQDFINIKFTYPFYNTEFDLKEPLITGDGVSTVSQGLLNVYGGGIAGGSSIVSSKEYCHTLSGKTGYAFFAAAFNCQGTCRVGLISQDLQNGICLKYQDNTFHFGVLKQGQEFMQRQSEWNGTLSPESLNFENLNIFLILFGTLGVNNPILLVKHDTWELLHQNHTEGRDITPILAGFDLEMTFSAEDEALLQIDSCCAGLISAGLSFAGSRTFSFNNGDFYPVLSGANLIAIATFRSKSTYKGIKNTIKAFLTQYNITILPPPGGDGFVQITLVKNASLSGANYFDVDSDNSIMQYDITGVYVSGGKLLKSLCLRYSQTLATNSDFVSSSLSNLDHLGLSLLPNETITMFARRLTGVQDSSIFFSCNWLELF